MAIPVGTTARNLQAAGRWLLVAVVVAGMLTWWMPGYRNWGALATGLLTVWAVWLLWRTVLGDRRIAAHPAYAALIGPVTILVYHAARSGMGRGALGVRGLTGAMNMSVIFHLWLLATGIMVCRDLLAGAARRPIVLAVCGLAMMAGPVLAMELGHIGGGIDALALVALAGVAVWLAPLWGLAESGAGPGAQGSPPDVTGLRARCDPSPAGALRNRPLRLAMIGVAAVAAALLARLAPLAAILAAAVVAAVLLLCAARFRGRSVVLLAPACMLAAAAAVGAAAWPVWPRLAVTDAGLLGKGEAAFATVWGADPGLFVMIGLVGWGGAAWLAAVLAGGLAWFLLRARHDARADVGRAAVWTTAAGLAACALLVSGGISLPTVTLAVAFTWGLLPACLGQATKRGSGGLAAGAEQASGQVGGWAVPAAFVGLLLLLGMSKTDGLVSWAAAESGFRDKQVHAFAAFFLTLVLAWQGGARKVRWGLLAIAAAALAGGVGEALQGLLSERVMSMGDWLAHLEGCAAAAPLYLLCIGARWCESADLPVRDGRNGGQ